jgi:hypothetical protein
MMKMVVPNYYVMKDIEPTKKDQPGEYMIVLMPLDSKY